ncbi:MAG: hypothetical protein KAI45_00820, partial [Melioribacteraceae bacterium]|nr:hypothetical protein [Melioribacteraceae bacterium]
MKTQRLFLFILLLFTCNLIAKSNSILKVDQYSENELVVSVDEQIHVDYGLAYPLTYKINIPLGSTGLSVYKKEVVTDDWVKLDVKTSDDFFNGIEVVRFDYDNSMAYVSVAFGDKSDSIYIQITDEFDISVQISYQGITKYYDNRDAVVTSTADDWKDYCDYKFVESCREFRKRKMWLSTAIITHWCSEDTWNNIQTQIDSGYVEAIAHSRNHPHTPYADNYSEVYGCKVDILNELVLPKQFRYKDNEYVYVWIAPFGNYDSDVDDVVSKSKYLVSRMYNMDYHTLPTWDSEKEKFDSIGVSLEIGPTEIFGDPWPGTDDIDVLNSTFDSVTTAGKVYHAMIHPNTDVYLEDYFHQHLDYISGRNNIWYAATGHLFLYQMLLDHAQTPVAVKHSPNLTINKFTLNQNYPNPF